MADTPVSIREVAALAGVSVGTVSNVLNRPEVVAYPTRSRVQAAIRELGFIRNESARQPRAGRIRAIGLIVLDVETPALNVPAGKKAAAMLADMPPGRRPTAVFCANHLLALGVLQEMTSRRIRVPDGVAIVGYDDVDFAAAAATSRMAE